MADEEAGGEAPPEVEEGQLPSFEGTLGVGGMPLEPESVALLLLELNSVAGRLLLEAKGIVVISES